MNIINQLDEYLLEDIQTSDHPSDFVTTDTHSMLVLRLPQLDEKTHTIDVYSYAFVIQEETVYLYDRDKNSFTSIGTLEALNEFLDKKIELLIKEVKKYYLEIDELEDTFYEHTLDNHFMSKWLTYKKELSLIHRLIFDATLSLDLFMKYHKNSKSYEELAYADLYEHMQRIQDLVKASLDKLDHLYNFYRAKVDEKMNKNIYYLTVLSGIFLPLTLISGFFGMNTGGLPFVEDYNGTFKVLIIALIFEVVVFIPFAIITFLNKAKKFTR